MYRQLMSRLVCENVHTYVYCSFYDYGEIKWRFYLNDYKSVSPVSQPAIRSSNSQLVCVFESMENE